VYVFFFFKIKKWELFWKFWQDLTENSDGVEIEKKNKKNERWIH
jgi:hypothetical protein